MIKFTPSKSDKCFIIVIIFFVLACLGVKYISQLDLHAPLPRIIEKSLEHHRYDDAFSRAGWDAEAYAKDFADTVAQTYSVGMKEADLVADLQGQRFKIEHGKDAADHQTAPNGAFYTRHSEDNMVGSDWFLSWQVDSQKRVSSIKGWHRAWIR